MATLSEERTLQYYAHHTSVIIDANLREFANRSQANALRYGAKLLLIETACPEELILERLSVREQRGDSRSSMADTANYWRAKQAAASQPINAADIYFGIDTNTSSQPQTAT